jgi:ATP-dependent Clp protease ATP-binding subunit ClpA
VAQVTIPEAFLDELTCHIMSDPVELPRSRRVVDRSTIIRHLHQHPTDPFNRQPLNLEQVVPLDALRQDIEAFLSRHTHTHTHTHTHINASLSTAETSATARASSHTRSVTQSLASSATACGDDQGSASEATHSSPRSSQQLQQLQHSSEPRDTCDATDADASDAQDVSETGGSGHNGPTSAS